MTNASDLVRGSRDSLFIDTRLRLYTRSRQAVHSLAVHIVFVRFHTEARS